MDVAIREPITGSGALGDRTHPQRALAESYKAFNTRDLALDLAIRTTRIFRRVDGCWRQVHHHGSMDDPALLETYQRVVR
jgi:hypothetical protein